MSYMVEQVSECEEEFWGKTSQASPSSFQVVFSCLGGVPSL